MNTDGYPLMNLYKGWDDYQLSLVRAITPLSAEQLAWRPASHLRSAGEIARHLIDVRIQWFHHVLNAGSAEFDNWQSQDDSAMQSTTLIRWLETTWQMIEDALNRGTITDLRQTYQLPPYNGKSYNLHRQWIIWHVIVHDLHHGGELALVLGMQGIVLPELGEEGGHLLECAPLAETA